MLLVGACAPAVLPGGRRSVENPWARLRHQTAWVALGDLDASRGEWATGIVHAVRGETTETARVPRQGDVLEVLHRSQLVILGYRHSGERDRLLSPVDKLLTQDDLAGMLPPGSFVRVYEVRMAAVFNGLQTVWVRLGPAKTPPIKGGS